MTTLPDWAVREPDETPGDWAFRLLITRSVQAVANAEPGWCRCLAVPWLQIHVCEILGGQPLRVTFRTPGASPVLPRGCGTRHAGECTSEQTYPRRT